MAKQRKAQATGPQWRDLRDWLELVDAFGELKHVRGASSEEDIGAVTEMLDHSGRKPLCPLRRDPELQTRLSRLGQQHGLAQTAGGDLGLRSCGCLA